MREPSARISTIVLVCATLACFGLVCSYGFTNAEDEGLITRNPMFNPATAASLRQIWSSPHIYLYVPATYTVWWLLASVARTAVADDSGATLNPWVFHSANLFMHVVASVLVLHLLRRLTRGRDGPALIGALLFAIHPLQTEAVAWTTGMKDTLCGVFSFAALILYCKFARPDLNAGAEHRDERAQRRPGSTRMLTYILATTLFILAMLAKPAAVVVPLLALVIDRFLLERSWRDVVRSTMLWFALAIPIVLIARTVQPATQVRPVAAWARPLVAADALAFYLVKLFWPAGLTINYGRTPQAVLADGAAYWTWVVPLVAAIVVWRSRSRTFVAASLLFVAGVLPVLGLTTFLYQQFSTVADRFVYLSMLGPAIAVAWALSRRWDRTTVTLAVAVLILLGLATFRQALVWENRLTLYAHAVAVVPDNAVSRNNYAGALIRAGRFAEGVEQLEAAMRLAPSEATREMIEQWRAVIAPAPATTPTPTTTAPALP